MTLDYYVDFVAHPIDVNLWEAELYFAAIPVQQLIGNLVYYSNKGRYEPRLAYKWERESPKVWKFYLRDNLTCENGEIISSESFKKSIERSLLILSRKGGSPVLKGLIGYNEFIKENAGRDISKISGIEGIRASGNSLSFEFQKSTRSGVVQILSFAPYGYICAENLKENGEWKDQKKFVSSGAYSLSSVDLGKLITLEKRENFDIDVNENAPKVVRFHQIRRDEMQTMSFPSGSVIDAGGALEGTPQSLRRFELVKEYMSSIVLGNFKDGVFGSYEARLAFKNAINAAKIEYSSSHDSFRFSNSMYPAQAGYSEPSIIGGQFDFSGRKVLIRGTEPSSKSDSYLSWTILKKALQSLKLDYSFSNSGLTRADITDQSYDIRMANPSVGGGVEAWIVDVLFCSKLNSNLPDPSNNICEAVEKYEDDLISDSDLTNKLLEAVEKDSAIFPVRHFGLNFYLSSKIDEESLSPLFSIMRFDQVELLDE